MSSVIAGSPPPSAVVLSSVACADPDAPPGKLCRTIAPEPLEHGRSQRCKGVVVAAETAPAAPDWVGRDVVVDDIIKISESDVIRRIVKLIAVNVETSVKKLLLFNQLPPKAF